MFRQNAEGSFIEFLNKINFQPNQIVFIDDNLNFLISVEEEMEEMNIPFVASNVAVEQFRAFSG